MVSDVFDKEENRKNYIRGMLRTLTKREENVLRMYFGLDGKERSTLEEIGRDFDLTGNTIQPKYQGDVENGKPSQLGWMYHFLEEEGEGEEKYFQFLNFH